MTVIEQFAVMLQRAKSFAEVNGLNDAGRHSGKAYRDLSAVLFDFEVGIAGLDAAALRDAEDEKLSKQITVTWTVGDVQSIRPDLSERACLEVLEAAKKGYDAHIGINWEVLQTHAAMMFGLQPDDGDDDND